MTTSRPRDRRFGPAAGELPGRNMAKAYRGRRGPRLFKRTLAAVVIGLVALIIIGGVIGRGRVGDWDRGFLSVGVLEEPKTLNPWLASDAWSLRVMRLIYQPLMIRDPRMKLIPWLAAEPPIPEYGPATVRYYAKRIARRSRSPWLMLTLPRSRSGPLTYLIRLRPAKWSDGTPLTADDVIFTANLIREFKTPTHYAMWEFVIGLERVGPRTIRFRLARPEPMFLRRTLSTTPIVQRWQWAPIVAQARKARSPLVRLMRHKLERPIGLGPFVLRRWRHGVYLFLVSNEHFFGRGQTFARMRLGPHIPGVIIKVYGTSDAAILALRKGAIDFYWNTILPGYIRQIEGEDDIKLFNNEKSGFYFFGFNLRRRPFDDVNFRRAVATMIDKKFIIERILQKAAEPLGSFVPNGTRFYCPDLKPCGEGFGLTQRIKAAHDILDRAGYTWRQSPVTASGAVVKGQGLIRPDGREVREFTILTPPADYDPGRAMAGIMIQEWLRLIGVPAVARPMGFGALIHRVKHRHDFDAFVFGYGNLRPYPSYLWAFYHSSRDRRGDWNMSGYRSPTYDRLANRAKRTVDPEDQQKLVFQLQRILVHDIPYFPLYNPRLVEGVRRDRFRGWVMMRNGIGNIWSFCRIKAAPESALSGAVRSARR
jgi:ABC-type transport system substrate-binding protein